jgi:hypothetical protein
MVQNRIERLPNLLDAIARQGQQFALMTPKGREDRTPIYGYEPTREAATAAFAKSWRRE